MMIDHHCFFAQLIYDNLYPTMSDESKLDSIKEVQKIAKKVTAIAFDPTYIVYVEGQPQVVFGYFISWMAQIMPGQTIRGSAEGMSMFCVRGIDATRSQLGISASSAIIEKWIKTIPVETAKLSLKDHPVHQIMIDAAAAIALSRAKTKSYVIGLFCSEQLTASGEVVHLLVRANSYDKLESGVYGRPLDEWECRSDKYWRALRAMIARRGSRIADIKEVFAAASEPDKFPYWCGSVTDESAPDEAAQIIAVVGCDVDVLAFMVDSLDITTIVGRTAGYRVNGADENSERVTSTDPIQMSEIARKFGSDTRD